MKKFLICLCLVFAMSIPVVAADLPGRFVAFGGGFSDKGFGWGALGIPLGDKIISYTLWDFTPTDSIENSSFSLGEGDTKIMLKLNATTGAAYKITEPMPGLSIWGMGAAGLATTGEFNSAAFKYGGFADYRIRDGIGIMLGVGGQWDSLNKTSLDLRTGVNFYIGK